MIKIAVDIMGFENDISEAVLACKEFLGNKKNLTIILVGDKDKININHCMEVVDVKDFFSQSDTVLSIRQKTNTSMQVLFNLLNQGKVDGVLSAGNSSIFTFLSYSTLGTIDNINKVAFMPCIPTTDGSFFNMLDVGASLDIQPIDIVKFALMANIFYSQYKKNPSIGILNIGTEKHKGFLLQQEADKLMMQTNLNYVGFVEPKNLLMHPVDIVLTDGFSGNLVLKTLEGTSKTIFNLLKKEYKKPKNFLGLLFSLGVFKNIKNQFDYKNNAGAIVLGVKKPCVKTHGSADKKQFLSALRLLHDYISNKVIDNITSEVSKYGNKV